MPSRLAEQIIDWSQQLPAAEEMLQACEIALLAAQLACDEVHSQVQEEF